MINEGYGRIINIISTSVNQVLPGLGVSNTIRVSVSQWAKTLAIDVAKDHITVNNILTGYFDTERIQQLNSEKSKKLNISEDKVLEAMKAQVPMKRIGNPEEFGYLASFLSSDKSSYITGANIPIDGGLLKSI
jgi:3-oxoacyl-[acyl-carrier protein] reductase